MNEPLLSIRDPTDEAFGVGRFHIEQMDTGSWWMAVTDSHGCEMKIVLKTKRGAEIVPFMEITGQCGEKP